MNTSVALPTSDLLAVIERAAHDPSMDVDRFQRLLDILEMQTNRINERAFNSALVLAQGEMQPINADASNSATRSSYATFSALDRECRPLYSKHGLGPSFNTEPTGDPNTLRVVCMLGHRDGHTRRYQIDMPIDTKGARGGDVMTRTHATGSAFSYGKRYLLVGMFNLCIDDDDDGNAAGRRAPIRPVARDLPQIQSPSSHGADERIDPETGEVTEHVMPYTIEMVEGSTWAQFLEPLQRYIHAAANIDEVDQWMQKNQDLLLKLKESKPSLFRLFEKNCEPTKERLANQ
jgi:ERF superfamily